MKRTTENGFVGRARLPPRPAERQPRRELHAGAVSDDDGEDTLVSRIALDYNQEINSVSSFGVNFGLGRSEDLGTLSDDTTTRANLGVTYRRALTRDWDWVLGYEARYLARGRRRSRDGQQGLHAHRPELHVPPLNGNR
jgi:hypothetical protein